MMVSQLGFSKLGQVAWQSGGGPSFVGQQAGQAPDCSGHTADLIDAEVKELVERSYRFVQQGIYLVIEADGTTSGCVSMLRPGLAILQMLLSSGSACAMYTANCSAVVCPLTELGWDILCG